MAVETSVITPASRATSHGERLGVWRGPAAQTVGPHGENSTIPTKGLTTPGKILTRSTTLPRKSWPSADRSATTVRFRLAMVPAGIPVLGVLCDHLTLANPAEWKTPTI